jgi:signal transduction histidine kinase
MYQENICEEAIREERARIAGKLDTLLQTFLGASMQPGAAADSLPSDSPVKPRLDRILQVMHEGQNRA